MSQYLEWFFSTGQFLLYRSPVYKITQMVQQLVGDSQDACTLWKSLSIKKRLKSSARRASS